MPESGRPGLIVLCDSFSLPPRLGFEIHLASLATAFAELLPVHVVAWDRTGGSELAPAEVVALTARGTKPAKRRYRAAAVGWIESHAAPGSLLWVRGHSTAFHLAFDLARWRRPPLRLRTVYDAASFLRLECRPGWRGGGDRLKAWLEERLWGRFDLVRTLGPSMGEYLMRRGVPEDRVRVVPVGCTPPERRWTGERIAKRALYVGSPRAWQGLAPLLGAMVRLERVDPAIHLTVVGVEPSVARAPAPNVSFLGRVEHARALEMYLEHDLLVVPRLRSELTETVVPMKIAEALAAGIPILATDLAPIRFVAGPEGAFYVPEPTPEALADALQEVFRDPLRLRAVGREARRRAEAFAWPEVARRAAELLFDRSARTGLCAGGRQGDE